MESLVLPVLRPELSIRIRQLLPSLELLVAAAAAAAVAPT